MPSLLPYLEPDDAKIRMDIIGARAATTESIPKRFPFRILNESSPLTRLLRAEILTDAGSLVQPVFLLVQKDTYHYQPGELWPLTNLDVEACWQQAYSFFSLAESGKTPISAIGHDVIRLGEATTSSGSRNAFQSLFFCVHRRVFFHPPCPGCGQNLFLCKDDALLLSQGLSTYSASLRRFLYCPSCPPAMEGNGFYVLSLGAADSGGVRDSGGLIAAWRYLLASGLAPVGFPCLNCPERDKCYGPENLAAVRIIPFGFYPFHMLVFKAMTIRAADFLPLVSGAGMDDMENRLLEKNEPERLSEIAGLRRAVAERDLFLFEGTAKHFLEILYLKLSFLSEITELIRTGPPPLDIDAALDCLWVKIPVPGSFLPGLWSFRAGYLDIGLTRKAALGRAGAHRAQISYFLGLVWFYVLLTNTSQPAAAVIAELSAILEKNHERDTDLKSTPLFAPENIFWNPAAHRLKAFPMAWKDLWEKTLELAWTLLTTDRPEAVWSSDKFRQDLSAIRQEIKKRLFAEGGTPAIAETNVSDDQAIHKILTGIIGKWQTAMNPSHAVTPVSKDIKAETTLLTRAKTEETLWDAETTIQTGNHVQEAVPDAETIVLTGDKARETLQVTVTVTKDKLEEDLEKTVVISKIKTGAAPVGTHDPPREKIGDEPCETIILSGKTAGKPFVPPAFEPKVKHPGTGDEDDILSETIILRPPQK
ncbi:MAG: hypothetical protein HY881_09275 [Deltaproteobacteria bacterium]|nr:hypothetical protein [Deltaproteobacteria bacterium]